MSNGISLRHLDSKVMLFPRTPATWIPDTRVHRCFSCNLDFSIMRRKHHCRSCGRIFCSNCSSHREIIPSYFKTYAPSHSETVSTPQRTCGKCAQQLKSASSVEWLIRILTHLPVSFVDFFKLRLLNHEWNSASNTLLSLYRGLQFKLSCQSYSSIECAFLKTHAQEFNGHIQWQLHLLSSLKQNGKLEEYKQKKQKSSVPCKQLLCNELCCSSMSVNDVLLLGITGCLTRDDIKARVIDTWKRFIPAVHLHMMPWWVHLSCRYEHLFQSGLIPICLERIDLTFSFWFECSLQSFSSRKRIELKKARQFFKKNLNEKTAHELAVSSHFCSVLHTIIKTKTNTNMLFVNFFGDGNQPLLPWDPSKRVVSGTVKRRILSSSRPVLIELQFSDNTNKEFLLKNEDVRTDKLAMTIGYWIQTLTHIRVFTYPVFPLSTTTGCVEMVTNTTTLYDLRTKQNISLLNYMMTHNPQLNVRELRQQIIHSCTGACLLGFTLGVGDRHLENILVRQDAALIHVDFGYILGDDPKHAYTPMRITEGMIDAMGGRESETFRAFTLVSQQAYSIMRLHSSFWYHLLVSEYYITENNTRHWKRIRDHVLDRFVPGEWSEEAALQIESVIHTASQSSFGQTFSDLTHQMSNKLNGLMFRMEL